MNHFSVLVIADDHERALAPFHEFECTGRDDEFVQKIDITAKARQGYAESKDSMVRKPGGTLVGAYEDEFYRDPTPEERAEIGPIGGTGAGGGFSWTSKDWGDGQGYRTKVRFLPEGCEEVKILTSENQTFIEYIEGAYGFKVKPNGYQTLSLHLYHPERDPFKFGYVVVDEQGEVTEVIKRTNPNKKYDYYNVGGRFKGFVLFTDGSQGDHGTIGEIDVEGMRNHAANLAEQEYNKGMTVIGHLPPNRTWADMLAEVKAQGGEGEAIGAMREAYWAQARPLAMRENRDMAFMMADDYLVSLEAFVADARNKALCTFAVLRDGQWFERGKMGWWGLVSDDKEDQWPAEFAKLIDGLPPETKFTLVDCHC